MQSLKSSGQIKSTLDTRITIHSSDAVTSGKLAAAFSTSINREEGQTLKNGESSNLPKAIQSKYKEKKTRDTKRSIRRRPPEEQLTRLAVQLVLLEKTASQLGVLAFIWATVVLLGGFVSSIRPYDFWVISAILITESCRVFSRRHELKWERAAARLTSIQDGVKNMSSLVYQKSSRAIRSLFAYCNDDNAIPQKHKHIDQQLIHENAPQPQQSTEPTKNPKGRWSRAAFAVIQYAKHLTSIRMSSVLYYLQFLSAGVCIGLSVSRLIDQKFDYSTANPVQNLKPALLIFYSLALAEASIFLIERAYWEFEINWLKLLVKVHASHRLHESDLIMVKQFFYHVYSTCLNGSAFDGLDMDLVQYSIEKLNSDVSTEQVGSVRILAVLLELEESADYAMRRIETTPDVIPRLVEMLKWKKKEEEEIRLAATKIIAHLTHQNVDCSRIVCIPGALLEITSLLVSEKNGVEGDRAHEKERAFKELKLMGLQILKNLAKEDTIRVQIGRIHVLLPMLVSFIEVENIADFHILETSLQVLRLLSTAKGHSGKALRKTIAEAKLLLGNLRDILNCGGSHPTLQELALDILTSLVLDEKLKDNIGSTEGMINSLLTLFLQQERESDEEATRPLRVTAGELLNLLVQQHSNNCHRLLTLRGFSDTNGQSDILKRLTELFSQSPKVAVRAVKVLRSICKCINESNRAYFVALAPPVLEKAFQQTGEMQEATMGLAAGIVSLLRDHDYETIYTPKFKINLLATITSFIRNINLSIAQPPRIGRHTVEVITALMTHDNFFIEEFRKADLETLLSMIGNTSPGKRNSFSCSSSSSGELGLNHHAQIRIQELVDEARKQLGRETD